MILPKPRKDDMKTRALPASILIALFAVSGMSVSHAAGPRPAPTKALVVSASADAPRHSVAATKKKSDAKSLLKKLKVAKESTKKYSRSAFPHWTDSNRDGCDTRREVLIAESRKKVRRDGRCNISGGRWVSYYDGKKTTNPSTFDIDHMVPLQEAWQSGASKWDKKTRTRFANDTGYAPSLVAVSAKSNRSKGARDPYEWLPPKSSAHCRYVSEWVGVKYRWSLSIDKKEKKAINKVLNKCKKADRLVDKPVRAKIVKEKAPKKKDDKKATPKVKVYKNCDEMHKDYIGGVARDKNAVNLNSKGQPVKSKYKPVVNKALYEANSSRDRDKDGIACEQ